jgi:hypothetical protein
MCFGEILNSHNLKKYKKIARFLDVVQVITQKYLALQPNLAKSSFGPSTIWLHNKIGKRNIIK